MDINKKIREIRFLDDNFFTPLEDKNLPHNPDTILNIERVYDLVQEHINNPESRILIVADPDIDGIMASSIMYKWLKNIHSKTKLIHHQRNQGHGVIPSKIEKADLLIIVDSSSNSIKEVSDIISQNRAKSILIIDHHETNNKLVQKGYIKDIDGENEWNTPNYEEIAEMNDIDNVILINVHQPNDEYPNKNMSGALTCLKVLEYLEQKGIGDNYSEYLTDLAAISIVSDVMNVKEMENRYYYYKGTQLIKNIGISSLLDKLRIPSVKLNSTDLAFKFNKAVNSMLRLQDIRSVFRLILEYNSEEQDYIIQRILDADKVRETVEKDIISSLVELYNDNGVYIAQNNYQGKESIANNFNGVIASKIADKENKSVLLVTPSLSGSARAFAGFNFKDYINASQYASGIGHQGAFGVKIQDIENLKLYFSTTPPIYEFNNDYEIELSLKDLTKDFFKEIKSLQYLIGNGFDKIRFMIKDIQIEEINKTSGDNSFYSIKNKKYIRFMNKCPVNLDIALQDKCNFCFTMDIKNYFGTEYYECECYNIEITQKSEFTSDWGSEE